VSELRNLLPDINVDAALGACVVTGISADSRAVKPGYVFFAVSGVKNDGLVFAPAAIAAGAIAIVAERPAEFTGAPVFVVQDVRAALSTAAARFYPKQPATIVAITGTSGKTSIA
jgi:UDP-N-acetylmuramyl tripeptide synthase